MNIKAEPAQTITLPRLMNQRELAEYLGKSTAWCERARWIGEGPKFIKLGKHVRYRVEDVMTWIDAHELQSSTTEGCHQ
ncbi:MAG: helix-turn-helix domain-containing protein [Pseudohongiellaceae bacterium]